MAKQTKQELINAAETFALEATGLVEKFLDNFPGFPEGEWQQLYKMSLPEDTGFGKVETLEDAFNHVCRAADTAEVFYEWVCQNPQPADDPAHRNATIS